MTDTIDPQIARANALGERVRKGEISQAQATAELSGRAAPSVIDAGVSDFELATRAMSKEYPSLALTEIQRSLGENGLEAVRDKIEAERTLVIGQRQQAADQAHAVSPEGRAAAAQAAADARIAKATQARNARLLLIDEQQISEEEANSISDDEALAAAGLVPPPDVLKLDEAADLLANQRAWNREDERRAAFENTTEEVR